MENKKKIRKEMATRSMTGHLRFWLSLNCCCVLYHLSVIFIFFGFFRSLLGWLLGGGGGGGVKRDSRQDQKREKKEEGRAEADLIRFDRVDCRVEAIRR